MLDRGILDCGAWITPGALLLSGVLLLPSVAVAQADVEMLGRLRGGARPPPAYYELIRSKPDAFQFSSRNGWVRRGRRVAEQRRNIRSRMTRPVRDVGARQAPAALVQQAEAASVSGTIDIPVMLVLFENTDSVALVQNVSRSILQTRLFGTAAAPPYSAHSYYREVSNDSLVVNGSLFDWVYVPQPDSIYEGNSNGLGADGNIPQLIGDVVSVWDGSVDFGQFDNDGPDGVPNSGDDDGYVDAIAIIHPKVDGSCQALNPEAETAIWAHRWSLSNWGSAAFVTDDVATGGGNILIDDYFIQGGQGGDEGCTSDEPLAMGLVTHEIGHLFGLPDLYDTSGSGSGIGRWGLLGSGNQQEHYRPVHMMAWTKAELGWVTEVLIDSDTTLDISPVVTSDTSFILPIKAPTDSTQYFILENRQRIGSDSMLIAPGLLVWHVDSVLTRQRGMPWNSVNAFSPNGVALEQADGRGDLMAGTNRGDTGDPFPGLENNTAFAACTVPGSSGNTGRPSLVNVENVTQLAPFGAVRVDVSFTNPDPLQITDSALPPGVMGAPYSFQLTASGGVVCYRRWLLLGGSLPSGLVMDSDGFISGVLREQGDFSIEVRVESAVESTEILTLSVVAPALAVDSVVNELLQLSNPLTNDERNYLDIQGNGNAQLDLGDFVEWMRTTGGITSAAEIVAVLDAAKERAAKPGGER